MYQALQGNPITGQWKIQQPLFGDTVSNLERSIESEHTEWEFVYPHFADIALREGFPRLATVWRSIAVAEKYHEKRFQAMLQNVQAGNEIESFYQSLIRSAKKFVYCAVILAGTLPKTVWCRIFVLYVEWDRNSLSL